MSFLSTLFAKKTSKPRIIKVSPPKIEEREPPNEKDCEFLEKHEAKICRK